MNKILLKFSRSLNLGTLVLWLHPKSYLARRGWFRSFRAHQAVDGKGAPIPWYVYPMIDFLAARLSDSLRVFEYGSGNSTLWYAARVGEVVAVEHDAAWGQYVKGTLPGNGTVVVRGLDAGYAQEVRGHGAFDLIVIDGPERSACLPHALQALTPQGAILWDDSHREEYAQGIQKLKDAGFRELALTGLRPTTYAETTTSLFYREGNGLGI